MTKFNHRIASYISAELKKKLDEYCKDREEKRAFIIREIVKDYFQKKDFKK